MYAGIFGIATTLFGAAQAIRDDVVSKLMTSEQLFYTIGICRDVP
jgi:hypothetical protein